MIFFFYTDSIYVRAKGLQKMLNDQFKGLFKKSEMRYLIVFRLLRLGLLQVTFPRDVYGYRGRIDIILLVHSLQT